MGLMMTVYASDGYDYVFTRHARDRRYGTQRLVTEAFRHFYHRPYYLCHCVELLDSSHCSYVYCGSAFLFWAITASLVMRVAPKNKKTQAIGMLAIGTSLATILGFH